MEILVETAILDALRNSVILTAIVPAANIRNEWPGTTRNYPMIVLMQTNETSQTLPGYNVATLKQRDNTPTIQLSVFSNTKAMGRAITSILDKIIMPGLPAAGLTCMGRVNDLDSYEQPGGTWHFPLRYQAVYTVTD